MQKKYIIPVKDHVVTSGFGVNRGGVIHHGVDFISKSGDLNIYSASNGTVTIAALGYNNGAGNYIEIYDGDYLLRYLHLDKIFVKSGDKIKQGQIIGIMGNTGYSRGTHLHIDVRKNKELSNFINFLELI